MVVTGTRSARRLSDSPVATEVISRQEIAASGAENLADLLEEQGSLYVTRSFAGAGLQMQGLDPRYTLILVDGQRVSGRVDGVVDLQRFNIEDLERIELVRGAASALYGSDALGGVVNIITRKQRRPHSLWARASYGSLNAFDATARLGLRRKRWTSRVSLGYHRRDAFDLDPSDIATNGRSLDQFNISNRTAIRLGAVKLIATADYLYRDQAGVDLGGGGAVFDRKNRTENVAVRLSPSFSLWRKRAKIRLDVGYTLFRDQYFLDQRGAQDLDDYQDTRNHLAQLNGNVSLLLGESHLIGFGFDTFYEKLRSARLADGSGDRARGAVYLQDEWQLLDAPKLVVVPGARVDFDSQFGVALSPKLTVRVDPHPRVELRASYGLGFRAPSFREQLLSFQNPSVGYVVEGNPDLKPERSHSGQLSVTVLPTPWMRLSLNGFHNQLQNMILTELSQAPGPGGAQRYTYDNVAEAYTQGVEVNARLRPLKGLVIDLGYTLTRARDKTLDRELPNRPRHRGTVSARYRYNPWRFAVTLRSQLVGPRVFFQDKDGDGSDERLETDPYVTLDLRVEQGIGRHLSLFVFAENLLDAGNARFLALQPRTIMGGLIARL
ncbi:MAG: ligand-gated channel protein [Proteobacteria bacterium]|nr:MAG: ligand-gated channel protein [Pseudomonadota bacterium]